MNSPGGDSVASDEILHELKLLSAAKPLVVSMSDVAASGGYFISMTGDPGALLFGHYHGFYRRALSRGRISGACTTSSASRRTCCMRGQFADLDSVSQPLSDAGRRKLHESIETTYRSFVGKVAAARKKNYDQIDPLAQGRVWMGEQARQNGLIDELGGLDQAIALVRQKAKLAANGETNSGDVSAAAHVCLKCLPTPRPRRSRARRRRPGSARLCPVCPAGPCSMAACCACFLYHASLTSH